MDAPPVHYVKTIDGYDIAYTERGDGRPFLFMHGTYGNVHVAWKRYPRWLQGLSERYRLITYDQRGKGLSTRGLPDETTFEEYERDIPALVDGLQLRSIVLYAFGSQSHEAVRYAHAHPDRVDALILNAAYVSSQDLAPAQASLVEENWDLYAKTLAPRGLPAEDYDEWIADTRESMTLDDLRRMLRINADSSVEEELRNLQVPLLVMHPHSYLRSSQQMSMKVAALAPNSAFVPIYDDRTNVYGSLHGDPVQGIAAIEDFLRDLPTVEASASNVASPPSGLSARELEVIRLVAAGKSNEAIADELVISRNTVRRHVSNIFDKTGVANRAQAVAYARDHNLV